MLDNSVILTKLFQELTVLRATRLKDMPKPEDVNELIADTINNLEAIYFMVNWPQDGFVPNAPKRGNE